MNIGITCFATFGGSGIIATEIGLSMARRGHRVHFICAEPPARLDRFVENVFFHEVAARDYPLFDSIGGQSPYALALTSKMVEVAQWEKLDLLHVHYAIPHAASAYLARQILRETLGERAPRVIATLHGTDVTVVGNDPSFLPITRFSVAQADGVTVPSESLRATTLSTLGLSRDIEVIPNFVDTGLYQPISLTDRSVNKVDRKRIVHNSNFRPVKRVDDAVRIFAAVEKQVPCELVLIGDGPERSRVERLAHELGLAEKVRFLGKQLHFVEVLQGAELFLMPSAIESFGLAALEAMACGVPVVATRQGGVPEVVADGENGFLAEVGDVDTMAAAALRLCTDAALQQKLAAGARATAVERFAMEPMIDRWEEYYGRVLAATSRASIR
jgi:N-acetyl-alpha-D-glucosaminyl L-malate synthase BshA